jgi:tRNA pseudouridine38-40 synthase
MPRYKLTIEYDGAPYMGWQIQKHGPSVQGALQDAIAKLNGAPAIVQGAGRTDAGVHALGQTAHVDLVKDLRADKVRDALNYHLGKNPISILDSVRADDEFHARFDAIERNYIYRILDRRPRLALDRGRVWRIPVRLDVGAMHRAAQCLIGEHDFTTFRDTNCQAKSPIRSVDEITVERVDSEVHIFVRARSFLHRQVRSFVGSLAEVGRGYWDESQMQDALEARARTACGPVAPADGLYLLDVIYPNPA